jgi:hypothetical protein
MDKPLPAERRSAPRRRLRDRIASLDRTSNQALRRHDLANHVLLVEDDLRETALALGRVEAYLTRAMNAIESPSLSRDELAALAEARDIVDDVETLADSLANLRQRMRRIATSLE